MNFSELEKGQKPDVLFKNCMMPMVPGGEPERGWIIISNGIIEDMGPGDPPGDRIPSGMDLISLRSRDLIVPGFYDAHMHLFQWSLSRKAVDLSGSRSFKEMVKRIWERIDSPGEDPFLKGGGLVFGVDFDESSFIVKRSLTGKDLDREFPQDPVIIRRICGHRVIINKRAREILGIDGHMDGVLEEEDAMNISWQIPIDKKVMIRTMEEANDIMLSLGILGGVDIIPESALKDVIRTYSKMKDPPLMSLSVHFDNGISIRGDANDIGDWEEGNRERTVKYLRGNPKTVFSKYFADGSIGARTASFSLNFMDHERVSPLLKTKEIRDNIEDSVEHSMIPMIHAIGDRAVSSILNAREGEVLRIEHAEHIVDRDLNRIKDKGIAICMQPNFQMTWGGEGGLYHMALGDLRKQLNRFHEISHRCRNLCFGSDMMPPGPIYGISGAMNHQNKYHSISLGRSIHLYSGESSRISFPGSCPLGVLQSGRNADLAMFSEGSRTASLTLVNGKVERVEKENETTV